MLKHEYARGGLELGLEYDKILGANLDRVQVVKGWLDADGSGRSTT